MSTVFIIHGVGGYPKENWFPWLKQVLEKLGTKVIVPQFPTPENQTLSSWLQVFEEYKEEITPETIVVGHSLGVPFLLNVIEEHPVKAAFFVAGFVGKIGIEFDESMQTFAQKSFDWEKIKSHCKHFFIFQSDNDPYIKLEKAQELANHLRTDITLIKGAGHFNSASGYVKFDILLEKLKSFH